MGNLVTIGVFLAYVGVLLAGLGVLLVGVGFLKWSELKEKIEALKQHQN